MSTETRSQFIAALRAVADLYEHHPELTIPTSPVRLYTTPYAVPREEARAALLTAVRTTGQQPIIDSSGHFADVKLNEQVTLVFDLERVAEKQTVTRDVVEYVLPTVVLS